VARTQPQPKDVRGNLRIWFKKTDAEEKDNPKNPEVGEKGKNGCFGCGGGWGVGGHRSNWAKKGGQHLVEKGEKGIQTRRLEGR